MILPISTDVPVTRVRVCAGNIHTTPQGPKLIDLTHVDMLVQGNLATIEPDDVRRGVPAEDLLASCPMPDILTNANATALRMHLASPEVQAMPWISLAKVSVGLDSTYESHTLEEMRER